MLYTANANIYAIFNLIFQELILTCINDPLDEIRNLTFQRIQAFFENAPLPISAIFCLRWVEVR